MAARLNSKTPEREAGVSEKITSRRPRLLFVVTEDWFFCSHFLDRAIAARDAGYDVAVATRVADMAEAIRRSGIQLFPINLERSSVNPVRELGVVMALTSVYRSARPDIVHHVALKPILYGTIAAKLAGVATIVNAPVGMGYAFSSQNWKARLARPFVIWLYRLLMRPRNGLVVVENPDDQRLLADLGVADSRWTRLIRGAGVDLEKFRVRRAANGDVLVVLPARMIWDKGVGEFVEAARQLKKRGVKARFALVGPIDFGNPASISERQLRGWEAEKVIEWWGYRADMPTVYAASHIVCLPSYREGLPKALIEAAACGRAIVTTDVPGCREVVRHSENGYLVPPRDAMALACALQRLIEDAASRRRMGARGRDIAKSEFSAGAIAAQTVDMYWSLISKDYEGCKGRPKAVDCW